MNEDGQNNLGLIAADIGILVFLGLLLRWALTSVVGFVVVTILVILMVYGSHHNSCRYVDEDGTCMWRN
jgi:hypothetical protein